MKSRNKTIALAGIIILVALAIYGVYYLQSLPGEYDNFAKCLSEKGVKMYGTDWCKYCQEQKNIFGRSFKHIDFVNCDKNKKICSSNNIQSYPTWEINNKKYSGVQPLEHLATLTGCELNK